MSDRCPGIPTGIHQFDENSHKIRSDPSRSDRRIKFLGTLKLKYLNGNISAKVYSFKICLFNDESCDSTSLYLNL